MAAASASPLAPAQISKAEASAAAKLPAVSAATSQVGIAQTKNCVKEAKNETDGTANQGANETVKAMADKEAKDSDLLRPRQRESLRLLRRQSRIQRSRPRTRLRRHRGRLKQRRRRLLRRRCKLTAKRFEGKDEGQ